MFFWSHITSFMSYNLNFLATLLPFWAPQRLRQSMSHAWSRCHKWQNTLAQIPKWYYRVWRFEYQGFLRDGMKLPVGFWQGRTPAWTLCWPPFRERLGWKAGKGQLWHLQCTHLPSNRLLEIGQANRTVTGKAILNPVLTVDPRPKLKTADLKMFINF